jgi:hypothetical protein
LAQGQTVASLHHVSSSLTISSLPPGIHATVFAVKETSHGQCSRGAGDQYGGIPGWIACKTVYDEHVIIRPHDVMVEIEILTRTQHDNVSAFLWGSGDDPMVAYGKSDFETGD